MLESEIVPRGDYFVDSQLNIYSADFDVDEDGFRTSDVYPGTMYIIGDFMWTYFGPDTITLSGYDYSYDMISSLIPDRRPDDGGDGEITEEEAFDLLENELEPNGNYYVDDWDYSVYTTYVETDEDGYRTNDLWPDMLLIPGHIMISIVGYDYDFSYLSRNIPEKRPQEFTLGEDGAIYDSEGHEVLDAESVSNYQYTFEHEVLGRGTHVEDEDKSIFEAVYETNENGDRISEVTKGELLVPGSVIKVIYGNEFEGFDFGENIPPLKDGGSGNEGEGVELEGVVSLDHLLINGEETALEDLPEDYSPGTHLTSLIFKWDVEGIDVKEGDTASMYLPEEFYFVESPETDVLARGGVTLHKVGTYEIKYGELKITFSDNVGDENLSSQGEIRIDM